LKQVYKERPPVSRKHHKKQRMEYKEIAFKDGTIFKGMLKIGALVANKKKYLTGTGELTSALDQTVYKGALVKGQPHGFGEKYWP
jgi:hypothetical protein